MPRRLQRRVHLRPMLPLAALVVFGSYFVAVGPAEAAPEQQAVDTLAAEPGCSQGDAGVPVRVTGLSTPESVIWDPEQDYYFVSNINGSPLARDNNGFITRISPCGRISALRWIAGGVAGAELNAPKGMALTPNTLWVADIDRVRRFDRATGKPTAVVPIPGATFLNDLAATPDGAVYVSDTGTKPGAGGLESSDSGAIWRIEAAGTLRRVAAGPGLGRPNGLALDGSDLLVVTMGSGELLRMRPDGTVVRRAKAPAGGLDGLVRRPDGSLLVSSWAAQAIYLVAEDWSFVPVIQGLRAPADIGWDALRGRLLIPRFEDHMLTAQPLPRYR